MSEDNGEEFVAEGGKFDKLKSLGKIKKHLLKIVGVLAIAALAATAFLYFENSDLTVQAATLTDNLSTLQVQDSLLKANFNSLQSTYSTLQSNYNSLQSNLSATESAQTTLTNQYNSLNSQYNLLTNNFGSIQANFTSLQNNYSQLMNSYNSILTLVPSDKGIAIDAISWNRGNMSLAGITNIFVRNLGTSDVHINSLKLFYNNVLQSSLSLNVRLPPGNVTVDVPVFLPPSSYNYNNLYTLKVMTLEGYNATSDQLPLCQ